MSRTAVRVGCWRRRVTGVLEEWPSRLRACPQAIQNPAYRLAGSDVGASGGTPAGRPPPFLRSPALFALPTSKLPGRLAWRLNVEASRGEGRKPKLSRIFYYAKPGDNYLPFDGGRELVRCKMCDPDCRCG